MLRRLCLFILSALLTSPMALAAETSSTLLSYEPYAEVLPNEVVVLRPKAGHHFNIQAPNVCSDHPFRTMTNDVVECQIVAAGPQTLLVHLCDDKKTYCKREKYTVTVRAPSGQTPTPKATTASPSSRHGAPAGFTTDLRQALVDAKRTKSLVLIDHTSENCPPCRRLDTDILGTPEFAAATKDLIKVFADAYDSGIQEQLLVYNLRWTPTFLLLNSDGQEIGRFLEYYPTSALVEQIARLRRQSGEPIALAVERFGKIAKTDMPSAADAALAERVGRWFYATHENAKAVAALQRGVAHNPGLRPLLTIAAIDLANETGDEEAFTRQLHELVQAPETAHEHLEWAQDYFSSYVAKEKDGKKVAAIAHPLLNQIRKANRDFDPKTSIYSQASLLKMEAFVLEKLTQAKSAKTSKEQQLIVIEGQRASAQREGKGDKAVELAFAKARLLVELEQVDTALSLVQSEVANSPKSFFVLMRGFYFYLERKDYGTAGKLCDQALAAAVGHQVFGAKLAQAEVLLNQGNKEAADKIVQEVQANLVLPRSPASWLHGYARSARRLRAIADGRLVPDKA